MRAQQVLVAQDEKSLGTAGGTFTAGAWRTRTLNTLVQNHIGGASLASNQITLPAGGYYAFASAPAYNVDAHQLRLQNVTDGATLIRGSTPFAGDLLLLVNEGVTAHLVGWFSLSAPKAIELQHRCALTRATDGLGLASPWDVGIFAQVLFVRGG